MMRLGIQAQSSPSLLRHSHITHNPLLLLLLHPPPCFRLVPHPDLHADGKRVDAFCEDL